MEYKIPTELQAKNVCKWTVSMGFATGTPGINASWFGITVKFVGTASQAVYQARKIAYAENKDICADWIFFCKDGTGKRLSDSEKSIADRNGRLF